MLGLIILTIFSSLLGLLVTWFSKEKRDPFATMIIFWLLIALNAWPADPSKFLPAGVALYWLGIYFLVKRLK